MSDLFDGEDQPTGPPSDYELDLDQHRVVSMDSINVGPAASVLAGIGLGVGYLLVGFPLLVVLAVLGLPPGAPTSAAVLWGQVWGVAAVAAVAIEIGRRVG